MSGFNQVAWKVALYGILLSVSRGGAAVLPGSHVACPCDGKCVCVPNEQDFGYFPNRWRQWPGENRPNVDFPRSVGAEVLATPSGERLVPLGDGGLVPGVMPGEPLPSQPEEDFQIRPNIPEPPIEVPSKSGGLYGPTGPVPSPPGYMPDTTVPSPSPGIMESPGLPISEPLPGLPGFLEGTRILQPRSEGGWSALTEDRRSNYISTEASWVDHSTESSRAISAELTERLPVEEPQPRAEEFNVQALSPETEPLGQPIASADLLENRATLELDQPLPLRTDWTMALNPGFRGEVEPPTVSDTSLQDAQLPSTLATTQAQSEADVERPTFEEYAPLQANWVTSLDGVAHDDLTGASRFTPSAEGPGLLMNVSTVESNPMPAIQKPELDPTPLQANWSAALGMATDTTGGTIGVYPSTENPQPASYETVVGLNGNRIGLAEQDQMVESGHSETEKPAPKPTNPQANIDHIHPATAVLDGYCPVELNENEQWTPGDPRWSATYQGHTFLFSGASQRKQFLANPDRYAPSHAGNDPVLAVDENRRTAGQTDHCVIYDGRLYMFASAATVARFKKDPKHYAATGR